MRRMIYLMLASLSWMVGMAQSVELMRVYTDKDCYLAGEELWVKVCVDDDTFPGNDVSRVAYVEICDTAQIRAQGKIALTEGMGWACIKLPQTMHSGVYQLTAYTRYMRNLKHDCFPRKYIAVLNTLGTSEFDNIVKSDSLSHLQNVSLFVDSEQDLRGEKTVYGFREKVSLSWASRWADAKELSLSVVRKDCEVKMEQIETASPTSLDGTHWVAECEGHIVTARLEGDTLPTTSILTQLSCAGKEMKVFEGKEKDRDTYCFYTFGANNQQNVVLSAQGYDGQAYRMDVVSPFAELLPEWVPDLVCQYEDSALVARSVALQLSQAMPEKLEPKVLDEVIYGQLPSKTYNLDEYVRFNTVKECIVEFVMGVTFEKENDGWVVKMLQEDGKEYNLFPILLLVDGVAFYDHSEVLAYSARQIHYIHQYRGSYALGERIYGGILSLVTHQGTMPDMRINQDMRMVSYEFPQERPRFEMPAYDNEERKLSRRPDFRHTMYWEPSVTGKTGT